MKCFKLNASTKYRKHKNKKFIVIYFVTRKHPKKQMFYFLVFATFHASYSFAIKFLILRGKHNNENISYQGNSPSRERLSLKIQKISLIVFKFDGIDMKKIKEKKYRRSLVLVFSIFLCSSVDLMNFLQLSTVFYVKVCFFSN